MRISERYNAETFADVYRGIESGTTHCREINGTVWVFQSITWTNGAHTYGARKSDESPLNSSSHILYAEPRTPDHERTKIMRTALTVRLTAGNLTTSLFPGDVLADDDPHMTVKSVRLTVDGYDNAMIRFADGSRDVLGLPSTVTVYRAV